MFGSDDCAPQMVHSFGTAHFLDSRTRSSPNRRRIHNPFAYALSNSHADHSVFLHQILNRTVLRPIHKINNGWR